MNTNCDITFNSNDVIWIPELRIVLICLLGLRPKPSDRFSAYVF